MANALIKDTTVTVIAGTTRVESSPGSPYKPAYTSYETMQVCSFGGGIDDSSTGDTTWVLATPVNQPTGYYQVTTYTTDGLYGSTTRPSGGGVYRCVSQIVPVYHPAEEAVPPAPGAPGSLEQTVRDFNLGWSAGARSDGFVPNDGYVQFKVPYPLIGAAFGLNNADVDASYANIEHAFYFSGQIARVYELGTQVANLGTYVHGDTFKIVRRLGVVTYLKNGTLAYTSALPSSDTFFLDGSLYAGGDYLYDPVISGLSGSGGSYGGIIVEGTSPNSLRASMLPLMGAGGDVAFCSGIGEMLPLTSDALSAAGVAVPRTNQYAVANRSDASMLPLVGLGSSKNTLIATWPPGTFPNVLPGSVTGTVTGDLSLTVIQDGTIAGNLYDSNGVLVGNIQGTATGTDAGDGNYTGAFTGVVLDPTTGAVIGYVSGSLTGVGGVTEGTDYVASVTSNDAIYVLNPVAPNNDATTVTVVGVITGTVGADGTFNGTYTGTITNPVTGVVVGVVTGTVTGTVDASGNLTGTYVGVVTDPNTGAVIGVVTGAVTDTGTLTPNGDGSSSYDSLGPNDISGDVTSPGTLTPLPPPTYSYTSTYGEGHGALQALTGTAGTGAGAGALPPPVYALGAGALAILNGFGISLTGEIGGGATTMTALIGGANSGHAGIGGPLFNYCESRGVLRPLAGYGSAFEGNNNASMGNLNTFAHTFDAQPIFVVVMNSSGTVAAVMSLTLTIDAEMPVDLSAATSMTLISLLNATMQTTLSIGAVVPQFEQDSLVYVVNVDSDATSTYEDYAFNSYGLVDGVYYGMKGDGLYALNGADDAGAAIRASVSFGKQDFGSKLKKRLTAAYVGMSSTGQTYLKVTTLDGDEYVYATRRSDNYLTMQRVDVGRGIEASFMTFELFNKDGADFELDTVEFHAVQMTRRI